MFGPAFILILLTCIEPFNKYVPQAILLCAAVAILLHAETRSAEYLTRGLRAAIYENRIQVAEYLLNNSAVINRGVSNVVAFVKSVRLFELLIEHGWDINNSVMEGETILPYAAYFFMHHLPV